MGMDVVVIEGARTPMGRYLGRLRERSAAELGVAAAGEAVRRSQVPGDEFDHAIFGNVLQTSGDAPYLARHIGLRAGLPVPGPDRQPPLRPGCRPSYGLRCSCWG